MSTGKSKYLASSVLDRAKSAFNQVSDAKLSEFLVGKRANISAWRKRNLIPFEALYIKAQEHGVDFDWLITGHSQESNPPTEPGPDIVSEEAPEPYSFHQRVLNKAKKTDEWAIIKKRIGYEYPPFELDSLLFNLWRRGQVDTRDVTDLLTMIREVLKNENQKM